MSVWNLPGFREKAVFPKPADFGRWQLADTSLKRLSASLKVESQPFVDPHEPVRAVPDPWAQARTFAEALIYGDKTHPIYAEALGQWRGLLALFALRDLYANDYTLAPRQFELNGASLFDRVLSHLTPMIAMGDKVELWRRPLLITLNGQVVAMGNPACLVSPGRLTPDRSFERIPWHRAGLRDPLKCDLPVTQLFVLSQWLKQLHRDLEPVGGEVADKVRQLLLDYAAATDEQGGDQAFVAKLGNSMHNELGAPYAQLFATANMNRIDAPATTSRTRLKLDPELNLGKLQGVILVDRALTHDPRFDQRRTLVWGMKTLGELLNSPEEFRKTAEEAAAQGWLLVTGDDLFTPRVAHFENDARIAGNPQGMEDLLAPLRPLALLLEGRLRERISARAGGGKAAFTLRLRLDDGSDAGQPFDLTRHFGATPAAGEGLIVDDEDWNIYHTSLWPDFKSSAWHSYFARFNYPEQGYMVRPAHVLSAALVAAEVAEQETGAAAIDRLRKLNAGGRLTPKKGRWLRSERKTAGQYEDIQYATTPYEAIAYVDASGDRGDAPAGLALIELKPAEAEGGAFDVAVDFGTTNTVACFGDGDPVRFADRLVHPLSFANPQVSSDALHSARWLMRKFFPPELRLTPTPTVAINRVPWPSEEGHHVFRNVVYFHSHEKHATNAETEELSSFKRVASQAKFNLKWTYDSEHAEASTDFLSQFVLMVAAEALADKRDPRRIRWRFSVPDSLDGTMRDDFRDRLWQITHALSTRLDKPEDALRELFSEGLAAAEFILGGGAGFTKGSLNLVLDIGGGTTDVTIWDRSAIHWIGSFRLAGQNFFTRTISQNPEVLTAIGLGHWQALFASGEGAVEGVSRADIPHLAEMLFSGPALQEAIDEHWSSRLQLNTGENLRLVAETFLAGIAWYLGRTVRRLVDEGRLREDQLDTPAFALCGRGAGLFKKMHGERPAAAQSETTRALRVFSVAAGLDQDRRPQLFTTPDAKLEVVRGMIASSGDKGRLAADALRFYVAGIGVALDDGQAIAAADKVSRESLSANVRSVDLAELNAFLAALRQASDIEIDLLEDDPQGAYEAIELAVEDAIGELRANPDLKHELEPPFIIALRALVDIMALPTRKRDGKLKMGFKR